MYGEGRKRNSGRDGTQVGSFPSKMSNRDPAGAGRKKSPSADTPGVLIYPAQLAVNSRQCNLSVQEAMWVRFREVDF